MVSEILIRDNFINEWKNSQSYISVKTSGTTGVPKTILLPKDLVKQSARATNAFFGINENSLLYSLVSASFIGGKLPYIRGIEANCRVFAETPTNSPQLTGELRFHSENLRRNELNNCWINNIDLISVVPSQMIKLIGEKDNLPEVRNYLIGGSAIPAYIRDLIIESGVSAWESYGMTETASHVGLRRIMDDRDTQYFSPMNDVKIDLDNRGCLIVEREGWEAVVTNDIAEITCNGDFRILGRIDNVIITGGKKFHPVPAEIKSEKLLPFPFYFTSVKDNKWGEGITIVVKQNNFTGYSLKKIREILSAILENWELPKYLIEVESFPETANGKIKRDFKFSGSDVNEKV